MANLTDQQIQDTFTGLLQVPGDLQATVTTVSDGEGTSSVLGLSTTTVTINSIVYPTTDGTVGQVVVTDGAGNLSFDTAGGSTEFNDLTDVTITAAVSGDYMRYNGSAWVDVTVAQLETDISHDNLTDYVANEHIDWTSTTSSVSTSGTATVSSLNLTANSNQIVLDSDGGNTTTITENASGSSKTITLPNATDTLVGKATTDTLTNKTFDANGTGNSLSNVDVADLANGTDGELITWSAAGAATTVAVGTSTHVLTSNGVGTAPTFQAAVGGGNWKLISTSTASTSASIEFTDLTSAYSFYAIVLSNVHAATDGVDLIVRTSTDNGSTYDSGASDYAWTTEGKTIGGTTINANSAADTGMNIIDSTGGHGLGNAANEVAWGTIFLYDPSVTENTIIGGHMYYQNTVGDEERLDTMGVRLSAADVDAIQFLFSSGNITSGDFHLYGIENT